MSALGRFFDEQLAAQKISARELASRMNVDPTVISRARTGDRVTFDLDTIQRMIAGISPSPRVKAALVAAILSSIRDKCLGDMAGNVEIRAKGSAPSKPAKHDSSLHTALAKCSAAFQADIEKLARANTPAVRSAVAAIARLAAD